MPNAVLQELFPEDNELDEEPIIIAKCKKISRWGINQDRVIILSTHHIYLLSAKDLRKRVPISHLKYIIKSTVSKEVILYWDGEYDFRIQFEERDDFLSMLKLRFASFCPTKHLKVFGIDKESLKEFKSMTKKGSNSY